MDTKIEQYFEWQICRTCMSEAAESTLSNDQEQQQWPYISERAEECSGTLSIAELLSKTMPQLEVNLGDDLPKIICHACMRQLTSVHRFQQMCIQSDREMREIIKKSYDNLNESGADIPVEEQELNEQEKRSEIESVDTLVTEQNQTSISDHLQSDPPIETCRDSQAGISDDNEEYVPQDNHLQSMVESIAIYTKSHEDICDDNDIRVATNSNYNEDVTEVTGDSSTHICAVCKKKFKESRYLKRHMKTHAMRKEDKNKAMPQTKPKSFFDHIRFQCDTCNKYFKKPESLYEHQLAHKGETGQQRKVCDVCEKTFSSRHSLRRHKLKEHSTVKTKQGKRDDDETIGSLNDHIPTTTSERPYLCPECGKSYKTLEYLSQHRLRHSDARPFECPICPARFRCRADISKHKVIHEAVKRHVCDICGEAFSKKYALTAHKRYHTGEKPFKCVYCEMRFVDGAHLRRHVRKHTGEKPYKCKYCESSFTQPNEQIKHLRTHLGENIYGCTLCPSTFRLASERRAHFVTHKNDDKETLEQNMRALKDKEAELQLTFLKIKA